MRLVSGKSAIGMKAPYPGSTPLSGGISREAREGGVRRTLPDRHIREAGCAAAATQNNNGSRSVNRTGSGRSAASQATNPSRRRWKTSSRASTSSPVQPLPAPSGVHRNVRSETELIKDDHKPKPAWRSFVSAGFVWSCNLDRAALAGSEYHCEAIFLPGVRQHCLLRKPKLWPLRPPAGVHARASNPFRSETHRRSVATSGEAGTKAVAVHQCQDGRLQLASR